MQGTIKRLMDKGYGFIAKEDGEDLFFHTADLEGVEFTMLAEGDKVEFEIGESDQGKGPKAINVKKV